MDTLSPQTPSFRKRSIFRRFSGKDRDETPPASPFLIDEYPRSPRRIRRASTAPPPNLTPPPSPPNSNTGKAVAIDTSKPQQPKLLMHVRRVDLSQRQNARSRFTPPPSPEPRRRVLAGALPTIAFPGKPLITAWNIFLPPSQIYSLYLGYAPKDMDDKWYIYSEGPDQAGKLKVHFHMSGTGMKVAELFVVMDTKGEGAGKIVGIKWNGGAEMNWMSEEEAKYMIRTACRWQLSVDLEK
ncbi:hypothetical protein P3342_006684 [Pyrenophora teres f. teres]|nr:hypothetical protein HRS9122_03071 [Pyrenophora teres f. teres]KAK1910407.1 hypothetical protein P3342_006684 [Pyrenophora teres f. teres]